MSLDTDLVGDRVRIGHGSAYGPGTSILYAKLESQLSYTLIEGP